MIKFFTLGILLFSVAHLSAYEVQLTEDPNVVTINAKAEEMAGIKTTLKNLESIPTQKEATFILLDLMTFVSLDPRDAHLLAEAHPSKIAFSCGQGLCHGQSQGKTARLRTIGGQGFENVVLGFQNTIQASFRIVKVGKQAYVCNVEGIYAAKSVFRKNIKSFNISDEGDHGIVTIWLSGASNIPTCE